VISRLNRDLSQLVSTAETKERLLAVGIEARPSTPREFHDRIVGDMARWAEVAKTAKIAVE
jgi:tripartite-type tricarboxylate transporter receptor subunit TctC